MRSWFDACIGCLFSHISPSPSPHGLITHTTHTVTLFQSRLELSRYDEDKDGFLSYEELTAYIRDLMPQLHLSSLNASFTSFYLCGALRKFAFFLDPKKRGG